MLSCVDQGNNVGVDLCVGGYGGSVGALVVGLLLMGYTRGKLNGVMCVCLVLLLGLLLDLKVCSLFVGACQFSCIADLQLLQVSFFFACVILCVLLDTKYTLCLALCLNFDSWTSSKNLNKNKNKGNLNIFYVCFLFSGIKLGCVHSCSYCWR